MSKSLIDLTNHQYGRLTVIEEVSRKGYTRRWLCRCECGNEVTVSMSNLRNGHTTSCGCFQQERASEHNLEDLKDKKFGKLKVLCRNGTDKRRKPLWLCQCDCGLQCTISSDRLISGETQSCGCKKLDSIEYAYTALVNDHSVDGVVVPFLTRKTRSDSRTGHKGVSTRVNKDGSLAYVAQITVAGKRHYLGRYQDVESAIRARKEGESKYHQPYIDEINSRKDDESDK